MRKKAILLPESLKLIIAVLCIILLVYLAWSLYGIFRTKTETEQARETLKGIVAEVEGLEEGQRKYLVVAPEGWILLKREKKLCMCDWLEISGITNDKSERISECLRIDICEEIESDFKINHFCELGIFECFYFEKLPLELFFVEDNGVYLKTRDDLESEEILKGIFEYEKDDKTLDEFIRTYLKNKRKADVENQIKELLNEYFNKKDVESLFGVKEDDFRWEFYILRMDGEEKASEFSLQSSGLSRTAEEALAMYTKTYEEEKVYVVKIIVKKLR